MTTTSPAPNPPPTPTSGSPGRDTTDVASDQASQVAGTASDETSRLAGEAGDRAREVADDARQHVRGIADVAVSQVRDRADEQVTRAGGGLRQASDQARALADGRTDEAGPLGDYAASAARALGGWADRLEEGNVTDLLGDVTDFARRKPGQFLAGAFVAGIVAGRIGRNVQASDVEVPESPSGSPSTPRSDSNGVGDAADRSTGRSSAGGGSGDDPDRSRDQADDEPAWLRDRAGHTDTQRVVGQETDAPPPTQAGIVDAPGRRA